MSINAESLRIVLQGLVLGFSIAAPVGPIGILCIRRTLERGFKSGVVSGLGAASADAIYGTIAAAGLTLIADFLAGQKRWLGILGAVFLFYLGIKTFLSKPSEPSEKSDSKSLGGDYFSTLLLTLSNPMTIFSFIAIFGGFSAQSNTAFRFSAFLLVLGVFCGSALWWLTLSTLVNFLRQRLNQKVIFYINKAAALIIIGFGVYLIVSQFGLNLHA
jgi:threonine/homoserine/homoserine lactone efflux protein